MASFFAFVTAGCPEDSDPAAVGTDTGDDGTGDTTAQTVPGQTSDGPAPTNETAGESTGSTDGATDPDSSGGDSGSSDGCTDECDPKSALECAADGSAETTCELGRDGCYYPEVTDCVDGVCLDDVGCSEVFADSCLGVLDADPAAVDGVYTIDVDGLGKLEPFEVRCDMTTGAGGWTLIAYNDQPEVFTKFNLSWDEYKVGFGGLEAGEFGWLGNDRMHELTVGGLDLEVRHSAAVHPYVNFSVGSEAALYELSVTQTAASGDGGFFQSEHDGRAFSTFDADSDNAEQNCAENMNAGWWYNACFAMSIASGSPGNPAYWRAGAPPLYFDWIEMWVR